MPYCGTAYKWTGHFHQSLRECSQESLEASLIGEFYQCKFFFFPDDPSFYQADGGKKLTSTLNVGEFLSGLFVLVHWLKCLFLY